MNHKCTRKHCDDPARSQDCLSFDISMLAFTGWSRYQWKGKSSSEWFSVHPGSLFRDSVKKKGRLRLSRMHVRRSVWACVYLCVCITVAQRIGYHTPPWPFSSTPLPIQALHFPWWQSSACMGGKKERVRERCFLQPEFSITHTLLLYTIFVRCRRR